MSHTIEKVAFSAHTVNDRQYFRINAVIDGTCRLLLETMSRGRAEELFAEIERHGGPECMTCPETMELDQVDDGVVLWICADCEGLASTLQQIENERDNRDEREGMRAFERAMESGGGESPSYRRALYEADRGREIL